MSILLSILCMRGGVYLSSGTSINNISGKLSVTLLPCLKQFQNSTPNFQPNFKVHKEEKGSYTNVVFMKLSLI